MKKTIISICFLLTGVALFSFLPTNIPSVRAAASWAQNNWFGGPGQTNWSDVTKYNSEDGINTYVANQATLNPGTFSAAYVGSGFEGTWSLRSTLDGGMVTAGFTNSFGAGGYDGLIVKYDRFGNIIWQKTYGGTGNDFFYNLQATSDGGYVASGASDSFGATTDVWVVKVDSSGNILWQESFDNNSTLTSYDYSTAIIENSSHNYVVLSNTMPSGGVASLDLWVMELNSSSGAVIWQKMFGGANYDISNTPDLIKQTSDGGYVIACDSRSFSPGSDLLVFKIDSTGDNILWQNVYNGIGGGASAVVVLPDGSFLIGGDVNTFGAGDFDWWILHLDSTGNILWQKTFGGAQKDSNVNAIQTSDGNILLAGNAESGGFGNGDIWVMKITVSGNVLWQKVYGGPQKEQIYGMPQEMSDGTVATGAYSESFGSGSSDGLILKIAPDGSIYNSSVSIQDLNIVPADGSGFIGAAAINISVPTVVPSITSGTDGTAALTTIPLPVLVSTNYINNGVLTSSIFDGGTIMSWGPLNYNATVPNNTGISFEVSTDGGLTWEAVTDTAAQTFGPSQTIAYRASLSSTDGVETPILQSVSINGSESPVVLTSPASSIVKKRATLNGNLIGVGAAAVTARGFEYGLTDSYGNTVSESTGPYVNGTFSADLTNLLCENTYNYRAYATNSFGTSYGDNVTFTAGGCDSSGGGGGTSSPPTLCKDTGATNYGGSLPCLYPKPNPTVSLFASPKIITAEEFSTLSWTTTNAISCSAPWTTNTGVSGSEIVHPTQTTKYKIVCSGVVGTISASSTVTVTIKNVPILCQDRIATNFGDPIPCVYPIVPPNPTICEDERAVNFGGQLPCVFPKPSITLCEDKNATNLGQPLPCLYEPVTNSSQADINKITASVLSTTRVIINDPKTKIIKNVAIAIPVSASVIALLASLLSGVPLFNYLAYLLIVISQFLGFRRAPKPWGVVYDSYTKRPIPFARVEVLNEQARKLQSTITDINGRYGFLISAQMPNIALQAFRTKYDFPSKGEPTVIEQKLYTNIYKGGTIINVSSGYTNYDLPMDPRDKTVSRNFYFGISSIKLNNALTYITNTLFVLGIILSLVNVLLNPGVTSVGFIAIILLTLLVRSSGLKMKPFGLTKDVETSKSLPFSFIALHNREGERTSFTVSDDIGRYFLLTPKGNYLLKAYTPSYVSATRTREIMVSARKGWVSQEIKI